MRVAQDSLECRTALPGKVIASSRSIGWTSLLIDHYEVERSADEFETRATSDQTIVVMIRGRQQLEVRAGNLWRRTMYEGGTVGATPRHETDRLRRVSIKDTTCFEKANLYLPHGLLEEAFDEFRQAGQYSARRGLNALAFHDPLICHAVKRLIEAVGCGVDDLYAACTARWLAAHLVCFHSGGVGCERLDLDPGIVSDRRIARVLDMMSERLASPPSLDELATEAGLSKFHFVRIFREKIGHTPQAFLSRLRLDAARSMLAATTLDIGTISGLCGYRRSADLTSAFTRAHGVTPTAWRGRQRR